MLTCGLLRTNFSFDTAVSLVYVAEPSARIELATPSLPRKCTATVLRGRMGCGWVVLGDLVWSGRRDSNPRQPAWKAGALPTELHPLGGRRWIRTIVGMSRQIYSLLPLAARASVREKTRADCQSWRWDSNPRPPDYKSGALPVELRQQDRSPNPIEGRRIDDGPYPVNVESRICGRECVRAPAGDRYRRAHEERIRVGSG